MQSPTPDEKATTEGTDTGTSPDGDQQSRLEAVFSETAGKADTETDPPAPRRKPGERGPDKKPRKKTGVPVEKVDDRTDAPLFTAPAPVPVKIDFEPVRPQISDESRRAGVASIVRAAETAVVVLVETKVKARTNNAEIIDRFSQAARCPGEVKEMLINDGAECWKKYFPDVPIGPEVGVIAALGLWGKNIKDLIEGIAKIPAEQKAAA